MSNDHHFVFICFVKNETDCQAPRQYLDSLQIPAGFSIDLQILRGNYTLTQGYNFAMRNSTAKYKIYLSKHLEIVNRNFLNDILALFKNHPELGMLGIIGAKKLPLNGNWREAPQRYGKVLISGKQIAYDGPITADYEPVQAVDGMIMITQYDLPWREDLFHDCYFYDTAQCFEFLKAGYRVGIPRQHEAWCAYHHPNDTLIRYYQERELFTREYREFITKP